MNILNLPNVMLIQIFEYLPYDEVAKKRLICKKIDMICQHILNCGFNKVVKQHTINLKRIKALLPRRESERRNHCLARHADILTCIETRISMLSMTYSKYMDLNLCCFIPGRVLDEISRILKIISKTTKPLRPHEVLQELRDISSMAIEHFDEKISHSLKKSFVDTNSQIYMNSVGASGSSTLVDSSRKVCCEQMRQKVNLLLGLGQSTMETPKVSVQSRVTQTDQVSLHNQHGCEEARATMAYLRKIKHEYNKGITKMNRMLQVQTTQSRRLQQNASTVADLTVQIVELKKRMEDIDAKNRELSASIKQLNVEPTTQSTATIQEYSNIETLDVAHVASVAPIDGDVFTGTVKRHLDDPPQGEERAGTSTEANTSKKAKVE